MKRIGKLLLPLVALLGLSSCGESAPSGDDLDYLDNIDKDIVTLTTNRVQEGGHYSEGFEDVPFRYFANDSRYLFIFQSDVTSNPSFTVESSRPDSVTIEMDETDVSKFYVITHNPGDSIIRIFSSEEMLVYRDVIRVRTGFSKEEVLKAVYYYDVYTTPKEWEPYFGTWSFSTTNYEEPVDCVISGKDGEVEITTITLNFTLEYLEYRERGDIYFFLTTYSDVSSSGETSIFGVGISRCAEYLYVYYKHEGQGSLLTMLTNPKR